MQPKQWLSGRGLLFALVLFIVVNLAAGTLLRSARFDLTENNLNTLSAGTLAILEKLDRPVTFRYYLAEDALRQAPGIETYAERVTDLLEEYAQRSGEKLTLEKIDPKPFSEAEDDAVAAGLQGVPVNSGGDALYFGLVAKADDGTSKSISFFSPEREEFLEYDLSELLYGVTHPEKPVLGILSAVPLQGGFTPQGMEQPWMVLDQLRQQYEVRELQQADLEIPAEVNTLLLVNPFGLSEPALYAADQFVLGGGKALVFADPLTESTARRNPASILQENPAAEKLLAAWGVELRKQKIVGDLRTAQQVSYPGRSGRMQVLQYLPYLSLGPENVNHDDGVTSQLGKLNLASAGALAPVAGSGFEFTPLLQSSTESMLIELPEIAFQANPAKLLANFEPSGERYTLAARLFGPARTSFPDGPPEVEAPAESESDKEGETQESASEPLTESKEPIHVIVIADTDLLQDRFWVQISNFFGQRLATPTSNNLDLVHNAIDSLAGSTDLIAIRSRGSFQRPFELVAEIQQRAELRYRAKEQELVTRLQDAEAKLNELQAQRQDSGSPQLTPEQQAEVDKFVAEKVRIRKQLRDVQYQLRADIEELGMMLKAFNIAFVPGLIGLIAFLSWVIGRSRGRGMN